MLGWLHGYFTIYMKPNTQKEALNLGMHQKSFDQQLPKTKELELLSEKVEKTTGQEINQLQKLIVLKSEEASSSKPVLDLTSVSPEEEQECY